MRDGETPEIAEKLARPLGTWKIRLKNFLVKTVFERFRRSAQEVEEQQEEVRGNPFLPKLRSILEQLLPMYQISYKEFRPLMIDTDSPPESLLDEDSVAVVLEQISEDLNFLRIATDRIIFKECMRRRGWLFKWNRKSRKFPGMSMLFWTWSSRGTLQGAICGQRPCISQCLSGSGGVWSHCKILTFPYLSVIIL